MDSSDPFKVGESAKLNPFRPFIFVFKLPKSCNICPSFSQPTNISAQLEASITIWNNEMGMAPGTTLPSGRTIGPREEQSNLYKSVIQCKILNGPCTHVDKDTFENAITAEMKRAIGEYWEHIEGRVQPQKDYAEKSVKIWSLNELSKKQETFQSFKESSPHAFGNPFQVSADDETYQNLFSSDEIDKRPGVSENEGMVTDLNTVFLIGPPTTFAQQNTGLVSRFASSVYLHLRLQTRKVFFIASQIDKEGWELTISQQSSGVTAPSNPIVFTWTRISASVNRAKTNSSGKVLGQMGPPVQTSQAMY